MQKCCHKHIFLMSLGWILIHVVCECVTLAGFNVNSTAALRFQLIEWTAGIHLPAGTPLDAGPKAWFTLTKYDKWLESISSSYFHSVNTAKQQRLLLMAFIALALISEWMHTQRAGNEYSYALRAHIHHWMCNLACISAAPPNWISWPQCGNTATLGPFRATYGFQKQTSFLMWHMHHIYLFAFREKKNAYSLEWANSLIYLGFSKSEQKSKIKTNKYCMSLPKYIVPIHYRFSDFSSCVRLFIMQIAAWRYFIL